MKATIKKKKPKLIKSTIKFNPLLELTSPKKVKQVVNKSIEKLRERMKSGWALIKPITIFRKELPDKQVMYLLHSHIVYIGKARAEKANYTICDASELTLIGFNEKAIKRIFKGHVIR